MRKRMNGTEEEREEDFEEKEIKTFWALWTGMGVGTSKYSHQKSSSKAYTQLDDALCEQ